MLTFDPLQNATQATSDLVTLARNSAYDVGLKILGAFAIWVVGGWVIGFVEKLLGRSLRARKIEETLIRYVTTVTTVMMKIGLAIGVLGYIGVQTTTFAALLGAAGVAIGMAWSGLLGHFAAGAFLIVLRPFKVGDFVETAGVTGTVDEIGLFVTKIMSPDHVQTIVGNSKVFADTIKNYSTNPYRRVDLTAQLDQGADVPKAAEILKRAMAAIPNVQKTPAPEVEIVTFTLAGPVLAVRPYCHTDHYWQVYFDTNAAIRAELGKAGFAVPTPHLRVDTRAAAS